jgi:hypothetical protein
MDQGGPREAAIRALLYIRMAENAADERCFEMFRRITAEQGSQKSLAEFKQDLREQFFMLHLDEKRAVALIPELLKRDAHDGEQLFDMIRKTVTAGDPLQKEGQKRLAQVEHMFSTQQQAARSRRKPETAA